MGETACRTMTKFAQYVNFYGPSGDLGGCELNLGQQFKHELRPAPSKPPNCVDF